jgi:hypothetical protein
MRLGLRVAQAAGHHPSCPFTLSGSSVGQRGILRSIHLLSCTCNTSYVRILVLLNLPLYALTGDSSTARACALLLLLLLLTYCPRPVSVVSPPAPASPASLDCLVF